MEKLFCILSSDTVDISLRRSAAEQLYVVLQGELSIKDANRIYRISYELHFCIILIHFHAESWLWQAHTALKSTCISLSFQIRVCMQRHILMGNTMTGYTLGPF